MRILTRYFWILSRLGVDSIPVFSNEQVKTNKILSDVRLTRETYEGVNAKLKKERFRLMAVKVEQETGENLHLNVKGWFFNKLMLKSLNLNVRSWFLNKFMLKNLNLNVKDWFLNKLMLKNSYLMPGWILYLRRV